MSTMIVLISLLLFGVQAETTSEEDPVAAVEQAIAAANDDPKAGATALSDALAALQARPERLFDDPRARELRARGQLTLARARLASDDLEGATAAIDEAIRTYGTDLEIDVYGPTLSELFQSRSDALAAAGAANIDVRCGRPCRVLVNERPREGASAQVIPGRYRVHVESTEAGGPPALDVSLDVTGSTTLHWPDTPSEQRSDPAPPAPVRPDRKRMLPRWAEAAIMVAGAAAIGAGAALIAIDGRCPGGADPLDTDACPQVYVTQTTGIGVLAAGGAALLTGGVLLTVDEVRVAGARGKTVSVGFRFRF